jgi:Uma2 family endonuclease
MSVATHPAPAQPSADVPTVPIYRLSVDQYHAMARAGILTEDDRVELLRGWLVAKMTQNPPHRVATGLLRDALGQLPLKGWHVSSQEAITLADSEPEPDGALVRGARRDYLGQHPGPQDIALVVEVAEASLSQDRGWKKEMYAEANIPVYWIVNLVDNQVEVYTDPTGPAPAPDYRRRQDYSPADQVPVVVEGREVGRVAVRDLLP